MILRTYLDTWLKTYVDPLLASSTSEGYRYALKHLSPAILDTELRELEPMALQGEINALAAYAPRQAQILHVALSSALWKAQKLGMVALSPMRLVDKPRHRKKEIFFLTAAEARAYVAALEGDPYRATLLLMLCAGLRRNEARAVRPCDLEGDILHIRQQRRGDQLLPLKTPASYRDIPLPEALVAVFVGHEGDYLCPGSENSLRRAHMRALRAAGIDKRVTLHGLRHSCATLAIENGAALITIQRLLGHRHFSTTADIYCHPDQRLMRSCLFSLSNFVSLAS